MSESFTVTGTIDIEGLDEIMPKVKGDVAKAVMSEKMTVKARNIMQDAIRIGYSQWTPREYERTMGLIDAVDVIDVSGEGFTVVVDGSRMSMSPPRFGKNGSKDEHFTWGTHMSFSGADWRDKIPEMFDQGWRSPTIGGVEGRTYKGAKYVKDAYQKMDTQLVAVLKEILTGFGYEVS